MRTRFCFITICLLTGVMLLSSCGGKKKGTQASKALDEVELVVPFSDFVSNKDYFRAVGTAVSPDMNVARRIATQNARAELASSVQALVEEVSTQYILQHGANATPDLKEKFEGMNQTVVSQMLTNVTIKDSKIFKSNTTNDFRSYIAIEMARKDVGQQVIERLPREVKDEIDFNEQEYRKIFDEVLKNR